MFDDFGTVLAFLLVMIFVILLAYFTTRWIARRYGGNAAGRRMKILERLPVAQDKNLLLVRVGGKVILVGVSGRGGFTLLGEFDESEIPEPEQEPPGSFGSIFSDFLRKQGRPPDPGRGEGGRWGKR